MSDRWQLDPRSLLNEKGYNTRAVASAIFPFTTPPEARNERRYNLSFSRMNSSIFGGRPLFFLWSTASCLPDYDTSISNAFFRLNAALTGIPKFLEALLGPCSTANFPIFARRLSSLRAVLYLPLGRWTGLGVIAWMTDVFISWQIGKNAKSICCGFGMWNTRGSTHYSHSTATRHTETRTFTTIKQKILIIRTYTDNIHKVPFLVRFPIYFRIQVFYNYCLWFCIYKYPKIIAIRKFCPSENFWPYSTLSQALEDNKRQV